MVGYNRLRHPPPRSLPQAARKKANDIKSDTFKHDCETRTKLELRRHANDRESDTEADQRYLGSDGTHRIWTLPTLLRCGKKCVSG